MNKGLWIFTVCLVILSAAIRFAAIQIAAPSFLNLIVTSLFGATWLVYYFMQKTSSQNFVKDYLLTIVAKLLAGGIFISALIYLDKEGAEANAILFMATYLLLTGLEVGFLFRKFGQF